MRVTERFSPHSNERPEGTTIDLVVLHFISLPAGVFSGDAVERLFAGTLDTDEPVENGRRTFAFNALRTFG